MQKVCISQIIQTERNLWRFVSHLRQDLLEQAFQDCVPSCFEYLHSQRINNLSGQPTPVFNYPYSEEVFFGDNFMCFTHCPLPLILSVGTVEREESCSIFFTKAIFHNISASSLRAHGCNLSDTFYISTFNFFKCFLTWYPSTLGKSSLF